jgi:hypothetical protein
MLQLKEIQTEKMYKTHSLLLSRKKVISSISVVRRRKTTRTGGANVYVGFVCNLLCHSWFLESDWGHSLLIYYKQFRLADILSKNFNC